MNDCDDLVHFPPELLWDGFISGSDDLTDQECNEILDEMNSLEFTEFLNTHIPAR